MQTLATCSPAELLDCLSAQPETSSSLLLVSGPSGAGKTRWCLDLVGQARVRSMEVGGLISPAVMQAGRKTGIDLVAIQSGERRPFATLWQTAPRGESAEGLVLGDWLFDPGTLEWGNSLLASMQGWQVLVVDELGPLEFEQGKGLIAGFDLIAARRYRLACVSIRPSLLDAALQRWSWAQAHSLPTSGETA